MRRLHLPKTEPPCRLTAAQRERFWSLTKAEHDCLIWQGGKYAKGYGGFNVGGRTVPAHRVAWEVANGDIPPGMVIDHVVCGNTRCVNPVHLEVVTARVNTWRGMGHRWATEASPILVEILALPTFRYGDDPRRAWITVNDVAWIIGLQPGMVRKLAKQGEFERAPRRIPYLTRGSVVHFILRRAWEDAGGGVALVLRNLTPPDTEKPLVSSV